MQSLVINVAETAGGTPVIQLRGEVDLHTCPELRATLQKLMDAGKYRMVLNLAEVPYLDSAALGVLVDTQRRLKERAGELYLSQVTPFVLRAFEITRLIRIFHIFNSAEEATRAAEQSTADGSA